jgi:ATP-dependent DNA helicase RecQ
VAKDSWEGVDGELFQILKDQRRTIAQAKGVPAYVVFSDADLRDMARRRPRTPEEMLSVRGVGEKKLKLHGACFLELIRKHCATPESQADQEETPDC